MATICYKPGGCKKGGCEHYRDDPSRGGKSCFLEQDRKEGKAPMKMDEILTFLQMMGRSQGRWGRLHADLVALREDEPEAYESYAAALEYQEFQDELDIVLYFEEGKLRKPPKKDNLGDSQTSEDVLQ